MKTSRPVIRDLERSRTDVVLEVLAFAGVLFLIAMPAYYYSRLPASIPHHFNLKGEADGWGSKNVLLLTPLIGLLLYAGVTVLQRFPHIFNYPWQITEANARRQYSISRQMMSAAKLNIVSIDSYITWGMIGTAMGTQKGLSPWFTLMTAPVLIGIVIFYLYKGSRALSE